MNPKTTTSPLGTDHIRLPPTPPDANSHALHTLDAKGMQLAQNEIHVNQSIKHHSKLPLISSQAGGTYHLK